MGYKSPKKLAINIVNYATNTVANTSYHMGANTLASSATGTARVVYASVPMHIRSIELFVECTNTPTLEDLVYAIRVNNTTDYPIGTFNFTGGTTLHPYNRSMDVPLNPGDYFNVKVTTANPFVTPPQGFYHGGYIIAECD